MFRKEDEQILGISTLWILILLFHSITVCNMYIVSFGIYSFFVMIVSLMFWRDMNSNINTYLHLLDTSLARGYVMFLYLLKYSDNSVREIDISITYVLIIGIIMFYNLSCVLYNNNYFIDSMYAISTL